MDQLPKDQGDATAAATMTFTVLWVSEDGTVEHHILKPALVLIFPVPPSRFVKRAGLVPALL